MIDENPMELRDKNGELLYIQAHVEIEYIQYSKKKIILFNSGFITEIDPIRPHVRIETVQANKHFDGNGKYIGIGYTLDFYHFTKNENDQWIASQIIKNMNDGYPLHLQFCSNYLSR